jgi:hypothetical protein
MAGVGGFFDGGNAGSGFSTETALTAKATALQAPLIAYFYSKDNRYFEFGKTEPEGAVIPLEIIGPGSPFIDSTFALLNPSSPQIAIGDKLRVEWLALDGTPSFQSADVVVNSKDYWIPIAIPDSELKRLESLEVEVIFFHLPQAGGAKPSPARKVFIAPELGRKPMLECKAWSMARWKLPRLPMELPYAWRRLKTCAPVTASKFSGRNRRIIGSSVSVDWRLIQSRRWRFISRLRFIRRMLVAG